MRESVRSLYMSGSPGFHDNDKRGGPLTEGSCWGLARGMESGHFQGLPRRRASARLQAVPLLCPELCSPSFSLASAPCPRTPCNDKARGERRWDEMSGGRRQAHDLINHGWSSVGSSSETVSLNPPIHGHPFQGFRRIILCKALTLNYTQVLAHNWAQGSDSNYARILV